MRRFLSVLMAGAACAALAVLAGCVKDNSSASSSGVCVPAQPGDPLIGAWYSTTRPKGVAGDYRSLRVLSANGRMSYQTQLRFGRKVRPALDETGCWQSAGGVLTIQTTASHGESVDTADPIYVNRYRVEKSNRTQRILRDLGNGQVIDERRMPDGYQLPD